MDFSNIIFEEMDRVARITFNRPEAKNALNLELLGEMIEVVEYLSKSDKVRALIITGKDKVFSGGADVDYLESDLCKQSTTEIYEVLIENYGKAALSLRSLPFPEENGQTRQTSVYGYPTNKINLTLQRQLNLRNRRL